MPPTSSARFVLDSRSKDGRTPLHRMGFAGDTLCGKSVFNDSEIVSYRPVESRSCDVCEAKEGARIAALPPSIAKSIRAAEQRKMPKCRKCGKSLIRDAKSSRLCYPCAVPTRIVSGGATGLGRRS